MTTTPQPPRAARCPCGEAATYEACCAPRHTGARPAETALALMRSRYSAFARGDGPYLVATCARPPRPGEDEALGAWGRSVGWVGLTIEAVEGGGPGDADGLVQFTARYVEAGALVALSERSRFTRVEGRWRSLEGEARTQRQKLGRNEPCPCGSGRKVKQCHA